MFSSDFIIILASGFENIFCYLFCKCMHISFGLEKVPFLYKFLKNV